MLKVHLDFHSLDDESVYMKYVNIITHDISIIPRLCYQIQQTRIIMKTPNLVKCLLAVRRELIIPSRRFFLFERKNLWKMSEQKQVPQRQLWKSIAPSVNACVCFSLEYIHHDAIKYSKIQKWSDEVKNHLR